MHVAGGEDTGRVPAARRTEVRHIMGMPIGIDLADAGDVDVEAAVLAKYPGATIERTETNTDGSAPYESHIKTSAGTELEVHVSKDFAVVDAQQHPAHP